MRIAVASCGLEIADSFIQCENFNYYTTKSCQIIASQNMPKQGVSPEEHAELMSQMDVNVLICNEISDNARGVFAAHNIEVVSSKTGNALAAAEDYVANLPECLLPQAMVDDDE